MKCDESKIPIYESMYDKFPSKRITDILLKELFVYIQDIAKAHFINLWCLSNWNRETEPLGLYTLLLIDRLAGSLRLILLYFEKPAILWDLEACNGRESLNDLITS